MALMKEILDAKNRLLDLEKDVEVFARRLRERTERIKQPIDQLSTDCELNCSKVWQEFDVLMEEGRLKAGELCDYMRRKTYEQQSKRRFSLQEKEELLVQAEMWRIDLRHLLGAGIEEEDVVSGLLSVGAKLSSRLQLSFALVEEGHFVVAFPEWCHRSLNQLQEEMIDLTIGTWPPRKLELQSECYLQDLNLRIYSIAISGEDGHIFVVDGGDDSIKEFAESGEVVGRCSLMDGGVGFSPLDICFLSKEQLVVCGSSWSSAGGRKVGLLFLSRKKNPPFLKRGKIIDTKEKEFFSLCEMNEKIVACDLRFKEIVCFSKEGKKIKRIEICGSLWSGRFSDPRLRADPTTGNLWGTRRGMSRIFIFNQNGQILQKVETEEEILDFRGNGFGQFYFCNEKGIFSVLPETFLYKFPKKSENVPRIFVSPKKLFVCFQNDGRILMKIFQIT